VRARVCIAEFGYLVTFFGNSLKHNNLNR
jgi:hypothetical protein